MLVMGGTRDESVQLRVQYQLVSRSHTRAYSHGDELQGPERPPSPASRAVVDIKRI
jgi:hypothetical protein